MLEYTINEKGAFCKDGHTMFTLDILHDLKRMAYLETLYANDKTKNGFSYVNIVSSSKECDGWLNLFFGEYCLALVRDVEFAEMLRKSIPEKK